jgi:hypothetical protein
MPREYCRYARMEVLRSPFWKSFDRFRHTNAHFSILGTSLREFFPDMSNFGPDADIEISGSIPSMTSCIISLIGRKLITTTNGYLGLAPESVQKGDVISIVYRCNFFSARVVTCIGLLASAILMVLWMVSS